MPNDDTQQIHYQWKNTMPNDDTKEIHKWWKTRNTWSGAPASNRWLREAESGRSCLVHRSKCDDEEDCDDKDGDDVGNDNVVDGLGLPVFKTWRRNTLLIQGIWIQKNERPKKHMIMITMVTPWYVQCSYINHNLLQVLRTWRLCAPTGVPLILPELLGQLLWPIGWWSNIVIKSQCGWSRWWWDDDDC